MGKVITAGARGFAYVLALASLAACNSESSTGSTQQSTAPATGSTPPQTSAPISSASQPPQAANVAPQIAGTPATEILVGQAYSFTPSATDANGDTLTFSIAGKPAWASFDTHTGSLSGTPGTADVGAYENIQISVSDGNQTTTLTQFAINVVQQSTGSVTLAWQAPTSNTDGSALTNLKGYEIHYGTQSHNYSTTITIDNSSVTRYVIENLTPGTYYFAISAVSTSGAQSEPSSEASKTI